MVFQTESIKYASLRYFNAAGYDLKKGKSLEINPQNLIPKVMEVAIVEKTGSGLW